MSRADAFGFFWDDRPPPKPPKPEAIKRQPPTKDWLESEYLPGYDEAITTTIPLLTTDEILEHSIRGIPLTYDVESYPNYFLCSFRSTISGKYIIFEGMNGKPINSDGVLWCLSNLTIVGFNSNSYDLIVTKMAANGSSPLEIFAATDDLIVKGIWGSQVLKKYGCGKVPVKDHIDLIEVAPLSASLKIYAGRMHSKRLQDLPFEPGTYLSEKQIVSLRWYNLMSDLVATDNLYNTLTDHLEMRVQMSNKYKVDLRSKSDAQIAEAVIRNEYRKRTGLYPKPPQIREGHKFYYQPPEYLSFATPLLQEVFQTVTTTPFEILPNGKVTLPKEISNAEIIIGGMRYKMGIGGLHSTEKSVTYRKTNFTRIVDRDVASYYPYLILNQKLIPPALGEFFLEIYERIVTERLEFKRNKIVVWANGLKIVINGTFGKLFDPHSVMYHPEGGIQVTVTGQLSVLMLIEWLTLAGIRVISANTDGIVSLVDKDKEEIFQKIIDAWEKRTSLVTEETEYRALHSRDVNNYIAIKLDDSTKGKGAYANPWNGAKDPAEVLHKNPTGTICVEAAIEYLVRGTPVEQTIRACNDFRKFTTLRTSKGGAALLREGQPNTFLGKSLRWYYATGDNGQMVGVKDGNQVADSSGAICCNDLPEGMPDNINFEEYIRRANVILEKVGAITIAQ